MDNFLSKENYVPASNSVDRSGTGEVTLKENDYAPRKVPLLFRSLYLTASPVLNVADEV